MLKSPYTKSGVGQNKIGYEIGFLACPTRMGGPS